MDPITIYATCAVGVFGGLGQNAREYPTAIEAVRAANKWPDGTGPVMRKKVTVDGEDYFTPWTGIPGHEKRDADGRWPE